ncbi:Hsp20 family protein [Neptuniibacter sp.]|uniref:Hsp20/alpha crystallin family protein n=1 Tax=Neptuniibacter sp. TaxID=1962643 RepID=UPI00260BA109|nr:Hsp20 family protein [Neptuniibacter sp.]MCP4597219.1 Hsp20/alpha crystallin family protein [Neptuniibacter sp.]
MPGSRIYNPRPPQPSPFKRSSSCYRILANRLHNLLICQERHYGQYVRRLSVGDDVDPATIKACFENGVLQLDLPKLEPKAPETTKVAID